jgi:hypothetical protein
MSDDKVAVSNQASSFGVPFRGFEGTVWGGTYNPADGTVDVVVGESVSSFGPAAPGFAVKAKLMTKAVGQQDGPQGGERAIIIGTPGNLHAILHCEEDDSPGAPAGESWHLHAKMGTLGAGNTPVWDSGIKLTNDGPTEGDGLGGTTIGNVGALTQMQAGSGSTQITHVLNSTAQTVSTTLTQSGLSRVMNGPNQTIKDVVATGTFNEINGATQVITQQAIAGVKRVIDGPNNAITDLANQIGLGQSWSSLSSAASAIVNNDMSTMLNDASTGINIQRLVDLKNVITAMITAMQTSGVPSLPSAAACIAQLATLVDVPVPAGSSIVRILS